jgi:FkbM family methyltransferase
MRVYSYFGKPVAVTDESVQLTPITFSPHGGVFEPESIQYFYTKIEARNEPMTIVDIGAQSGLYTLYAQYLPHCTFHAFEPNPETFKLLEDNCKLNKITNAKLYNKGLGQENSTLRLKVPFRPDEKGLCSFGETPIRFNSYQEVEVPVTTLDSMFYDQNQRVDFIKCDTEGWEPNVLRGGKNTLREYKPDIFLEVNEENLKQCSSSTPELLYILDEYGYKFVTCKNNENYYFSARGTTV